MAGLSLANVMESERTRFNSGVKALWGASGSEHLGPAWNRLESLYGEVEELATRGALEIEAGRNMSTIEKELAAGERPKGELVAEGIELLWRQTIVRTELKVRDSLQVLFFSCNTRNLYGVVLASRAVLEHVAILQYVFDEIPWKTSAATMAEGVAYMRKLQTIIVGSRFRWSELFKGNVRQLMSSPELKRPARESLPAITPLVERLEKALAASERSESGKTGVRMQAGELVVLYAMLSDVVHPGWGGEFIYGPRMSGVVGHGALGGEEFKLTMLLFCLPVVGIVSHLLWVVGQLPTAKPTFLRTR